MTPKEYHRMTAAQLRGQKARTLRPIESRSQTIATGTLVTIKRKNRGLEIQTEQCEHCGQQSTISKVSPGAIELEPKDTDPGRRVVRARPRGMIRESQ